MYNIFSMITDLISVRSDMVRTFIAHAHPRNLTLFTVLFALAQSQRATSTITSTTAANLLEPARRNRTPSFSHPSPRFSLPLARLGVTTRPPLPRLRGLLTRFTSRRSAESPTTRPSCSNQGPRSGQDCRRRLRSLTGFVLSRLLNLLGSLTSPGQTLS